MVSVDVQDCESVVIADIPVVFAAGRYIPFDGIVAAATVNRDAVTLPAQLILTALVGPLHIMLPDLLSKTQSLVDPWPCKTSPFVADR